MLRLNNVHNLSYNNHGFQLMTPVLPGRNGKLRAYAKLWAVKVCSSRIPEANHTEQIHNSPNPNRIFQRLPPGGCGIIITNENIILYF